MLQETFYNGVVIGARDEATLNEGELTQADEAVYLPTRPAPEPSRGRNPLLDAPEDNTLGIKFIPRETDTSDVIFTFQNDGEGDYSYRFLELDGEEPTQAATTEITIDSGPGTLLDVARLGNYVILVNGSNAGTENDANGGIIVPLDVASGDAAPIKFVRTDLTITASLGSTDEWVGEEGGFWWWITEYDAGMDIESPASDRASFFVNVDGSDDAVLIALVGTQTNSRATHWRLYRSDLDNSGLDPFPLGYLVAEIPLGTTSYSDIGTVDTSVPFRFLTISVDGAPLINFEQMGETFINPTTITVFENSLVANREPGSSVIHYSYPDSPSSWPDAYFINLEEAGGVKKLIRLSNCVIALTNTHTIRIDFLPRETDAQFARGRAWQTVSSSHGLAGAEAATLFTPDGAEPAVAFMAPSGSLYVTDGLRVEALETDIDWTQLIEDFSTVVLRDFTQLKCLAVYYTPKAAADGF